MEGVTALVVWLVIALVLVGLEMATLAFIALYLALGAVAAAITGAAGGNLVVQLLVFAVVSVASIFLTRRRSHRELHRAGDRDHRLPLRIDPPNGRFGEIGRAHV